MEIKSVNPKIKQNQLAKEVSCSSSTLQRYRIDINMLSPYRIPPNSNKGKQIFSNREHDLERLQRTSNDLKRPQTTSKDNGQPDINTESTVKHASNKRNKNILKAGSVHEIIEIHDKYLNEILRNGNR